MANAHPSAIAHLDLNQPIQVDVYRKLIKCGYLTSQCEARPRGSNETMQCVCPVAVVNGYTPKLVYPKAIRTVDPLWSSCYLDVYGIEESPIALKPTPIADHGKLYVTATPGDYPAAVVATPSATAVGM